MIVKSIALMRYLVRLVAPPGAALILDPFAGCYDAETSVATARGFIAWPAVRDDDEFLVRAMNGRTTYRRAVAVQRLPYSGPMHQYAGRSLDLCVTPNHKLLVREHHAKECALIASEDLTHRWYSIPNGSSWRGEGTGGVPFRGCAIETWCRFVGLFLAEGFVHWTGRGNAVLVKQSKNPAAVASVREIWRALPIGRYREHFNAGAYLGVRQDRELKVYCKALGRQPVRRIPRELLRLDRAALSALLDGLLLGDGSVTKNGRATYYTCSVGLADDVAELFVKLGYAATISTRWREPSTIRGRRVEANYPEHCVSARYAVGTKIDLWRMRTVRPYDGTVYCATVPPEHVLLVKRNGKIAWCGNSGTTGMAAVLEGHRFIGCELTDEYVPIARARITAAIERAPELAYTDPSRAEEAFGLLDTLSSGGTGQLTTGEDSCTQHKRGRGDEAERTGPERSAAASRQPEVEGRGDRREHSSGAANGVQVAERNLDAAACLPPAAARAVDVAERSDVAEREDGGVKRRRMLIEDVGSIESSGTVGGALEGAQAGTRERTNDGVNGVTGDGGGALGGVVTDVRTNERAAVGEMGETEEGTRERADARSHEPNERKEEAMRYIVSVESNLKGGVSCKLGAKTLIVGDNGCHRAGQGILLYDGTVRRVEEIAVGDRLVGLDGPRTVQALCRGSAEMYEVAPTKGNAFYVNSAHVLTLVYCASDRRYGMAMGELCDVSVQEWLGWSALRKNLFKLFRSAAVFEADEDSEKPLPIDPYFLGVLLGDGALTRGVCVTKPDPEIADLMRVEGAKWGLNPVPQHKGGQIVGWQLSAERGGSSQNRRNPALEALRSLGLAGLTSGERFVPPSYRRGSTLTRLSVLAGLLDTDGSLSGTHFDYISQSRQLADDVTFLARSVGLSGYVQACEKHDQNGHGGMYYRVSIGGRTHIVPTRIARKRAQAWTVPSEGRKGGYKDALRTGFHVTATGNVEPFYGFTLDGDGRYLLDDFTVTHNSGKSAIVNAVELATSGRVSDVVGRDTVAVAAELISLAPNRKGPLWAKATLSDGAVFSFSTGEGKKKAASHEMPGDVDPDRVFPLRAVRDAVLGKPETTRKFFLGLVAGGVADDDILRRIPEALHARFKRALIRVTGAMTPVDKLLNALDEAGSKAREANSKAKGSEEAATQAGTGLPPEPTEVQSKGAKDALAAVRAELEAAISAAVRAEELQRARDNLAAQRDRIEAARVNVGQLREYEQKVLARLAEIEAQLVTIQAPAPLTAEQTAMATVLLALGRGAEQTTAEQVACPCCAQLAPRQGFIDRANAAKTKLEKRNADSRGLVDLESRRSKGTVLLQETRGKIAAAESALVQAEQLLAAVSAGETVVMPTNIVELREKVAAAEKVVAAQEAARAAWAASRRARDATIEARKELAEWESLVTECKRVVKELLDGGTDAFVDKVQRHLPPGFKFSLRLREGEREVCYHGFIDSPSHGAEERGKVLHTALSGAEWAVEQAAIAAAVVETWAAQSKPGQVFIVVPEDRGLRPTSLDRILDAFSSCPGQVIIATPTEPTKVPIGWSVINTDRAEHRAA